MDKEISTIDFIRMKLKRNKNKKIVLTTDEIIKYNSLKVGGVLPWYTILTWPVYTIFWAGLFNLVLRYSFSINLTESLLRIFTVFPKVWIYMIMFCVIIGLALEYSYGKINKRLVLKIVGERKR